MTVSTVFARSRDDGAPHHLEAHGDHRPHRCGDHLLPHPQGHRSWNALHVARTQGAVRSRAVGRNSRHHLRDRATLGSNLASRDLGISDSVSGGLGVTQVFLFLGIAGGIALLRARFASGRKAQEELEGLV
ncbi:hypothetical protein IOD13_01715 [Brevibacterium casei]|nr:hypothetical protein [Brevibacterium casei]